MIASQHHAGTNYGMLVRGRLTRRFAEEDRDLAGVICLDGRAPAFQGRRQKAIGDTPRITRQVDGADQSVMWCFKFGLMIELFFFPVTSSHFSPRSFLISSTFFQASSFIWTNDGACGSIIGIGKIESRQERASTWAHLARGVANARRSGAGTRSHPRDCGILIHPAGSSLRDVL